jgi:D-amino-acid dehydrogenase
VAARSYLVVGGGIVGAAAALRLQAAGFEVTLIDPGDPRRGASFGNIGHIAAEQVVPLASPKTLWSFPRQLFAFGGALDFRRADMALWLPWAMKFARASNAFQAAQGTLALDALQRESMAAWERLFSLANVPSLIRANGHFVVWMNPVFGKRALDDWMRTPVGSARIRPLTHEELAKVGSAMKATPASGIAFAGTGQVSEPQAVREAVLAAFAGRGGGTITDTVSAVNANGNAVIALLESGASIKADAAVIAAGAWSRPLMKGLGIDVPLIAERGYSMQSAEHAWPNDLPAVVFEERALVLTRFTGGLRCSSFVELGSPDAPPDKRKWEALARHLDELGIQFSTEPDRWCGPRPTLPDYLPAIGRMEQHPRILYAFGHQHLGLTLASVTAELIESLALWNSPRINIAPFRIERFL